MGTYVAPRTCLIYKPDVSAYIDEMNALRAEAGNNFDDLRDQLDMEKKAKMVLRYEVCLFSHL